MLTHEKIMLLEQRVAELTERVAALETMQTATVARSMPEPQPPRVDVSIHAPAKGATFCILQIMSREIIVSIHAPARGAT